MPHAYEAGFALGVNPALDSDRARAKTYPEISLRSVWHQDFKLNPTQLRRTAKLIDRTGHDLSAVSKHQKESTDWHLTKI